MPNLKTSLAFAFTLTALTGCGRPEEETTSRLPTADVVALQKSILPAIGDYPADPMVDVNEKPVRLSSTASGVITTRSKGGQVDETELHLHSKQYDFDLVVESDGIQATLTVLKAYINNGQDYGDHTDEGITVTAKQFLANEDDLRRVFGKTVDYMVKFSGIRDAAAFMPAAPENMRSAAAAHSAPANE